MPPTITTCPPAPSRSSDTPSQFAAKADTFAEYIEGMPVEYNAFAAALLALTSGVDFNGTSVSSVAIGTGSKTWTTQSGKLWQIGQFVTVADSTNPVNYCYGQVTAYSSTTLTVNVTATGGSGTKTAWAIGLAANVSLISPGQGGTGQTSLQAAFAALKGFTTTATAGATTTLTNVSTSSQIFTGTLAQTVVLPVVSTLVQGWAFFIANRSTQSIVVNSSGGNLVATVLPGTSVAIECILTTGTSAASWDSVFDGATTTTGAGAQVLATAPTISDPVWAGSAREVDYGIIDGAGFAINPRNGAIQRVTLASNRTPTAAGWNNGDTVKLNVTAGAYTIDWSSVAVTWINGLVPVLLTSGITPIRLWKSNGVMYGLDETPGRIISDEIIEVGAATINGVGSGSPQTPSVSLTALTGGIGAAAKADDLVIVAISTSSFTSVTLAMTTAGYTQQGSTLSVNNGSIHTSLAVFTKKMSGSPDTAAQVNIGANGSAGSYAIAVKVFRNVDATTPMDVAATTATDAVSALADPPSINPLTGGSMIVTAGSAAHNQGAGTFTHSAAKSVTSTGYDATTYDATVALSQYLRGPIAAVDPAAYAFSLSDTGACSAAITLALRKA